MIKDTLHLNEQEFLLDEDEEAVSQALLNMKMMIDQLINKTKRTGGL
jgi:hypothetical protein